MHLEKKVYGDEFLIFAEMQPPKGVDVHTMLACANAVKGRVDAFVVPEMSNAVMRMSSLGGALLLQTKGYDVVVQVCCRDRNRLALQGDLLAAAALGVSAVMAVDGEDPSFGDHHRARAVYDLSLEELLQAIQGLQQGRDMAGVELSGSPKFIVGASVNCGVSGGALDHELAELDKKVAAGVQFLVTPPVFDVNVMTAFLKRLGNRNIKIIPTVLLLKSVGMARYIERNLPHISMPGLLLQRLQKAPDKVQECVQIAAELISAFKATGCAGVMISTIGWEDKLRHILDKVKK